MADRIALMQSGEFLQLGAPADLYHSPATADVAEFFGTMNWLPGKIAGLGIAETAIGQVRFADRAAVTGEVVLGFRPECVSVLEAAAPEKQNVFSANLLSTTFLGDQSILTVALADRVFSGKCRTVASSCGAALRVHIDPADVMVFAGGKRLGRAADVSAARAAV